MLTRPPSLVPRHLSLSVPRNGILFVVSAPSGAGKTTLCRYLVDMFPEIRQSISFTTRTPREGEVDGVDYHFVGRETFERMVAEGAFAEWAEVHGNLYGTSLRTLQQAREAGEDILLDIDCQGAAQLRDRLDDAVFVFILPPSLKELERRLRGRQTDAEDVIARRLANARREIAQAHWYDYLLVNADLEESAAQLRAIVMAERCRTRRFRDAPARWYGIDEPDC